MKTRLWLLSLLFAILVGGADAFGQLPALDPLPGSGSVKRQTQSSRFTFLVAGDNRPAKKDCSQPETVHQIFKAARNLNLAFILWAGDTISGKQPDHPKRTRRQYKEFLALARLGRAPVFNAPGNHEMDGSTDQPDEGMQKLYQADMVKQLYGAFTYGNSRFIALNTDEIAPQATTGSKQSKSDGYVSDEQIKLLRKDLEQNRDKAHIFIFMHRPIKANPEGAHGLESDSAKKLQDTFKGFKNISYVIAAHQHLYYNPQDPTNITTVPGIPSKSGVEPPFYLVTGGAGAPLVRDKEGDMVAGAFHNYLVFEVKGDQVNARLFNLGSIEKPCVQARQ